MQASTNQTAAPAQPQPLQADSQPQTQTSSQPPKLSPLADPGGSRQLKGKLNWQEAASQQEPDPVSDPEAPGTNSGESGVAVETPGADIIGATPSRPGDNSRVLGAKSEVFGAKSDLTGAKSEALGAKSVVPGAKSDALGAKAVAPGSNPGRGEQGNAQGSSLAQHLHGSLGHQAAAGILRCKLHCIAAMTCRY